MASGDAVVQIMNIVPTATVYATLDTRASASSPAANVMVWDFDANTSEYLDFMCKLEGYSGGGLTFTIVWSASTATSGQARWEIGIRRVQDDGEDIDTSHSYDTNGVSDTCADTSGEVSYCTIAFTDGSDMDSWAEGEVAIVRIYRDHDHGDDGMSGDAELWGIFGLET